MRSLFFVLLSVVFFLGGCSTPVNEKPMASQFDLDASRNKDCGSLKKEIESLEQQICQKTGEVDKKKGDNFLLATAGCATVVPWFYMDMEGIEYTETEIEHLRQKHQALSEIAVNKGCVIKPPLPHITGKDDNPNTILEAGSPDTPEDNDELLVCKYCGPSDCKEWHIIDGQYICHTCYIKHNK